MASRERSSSAFTHIAARLPTTQNCALAGPRVRTLKYPMEPSVLRAVHRKGAVPIRNEVGAGVYLELLPLASVAADLGLGSTRWEPAMELLEPGTTV